MILLQLMMEKNGYRRKKVTKIKINNLIISKDGKIIKSEYYKNNKKIDIL
jgi:hypothetical protein